MVALLKGAAKIGRNVLESNNMVFMDTISRYKIVRHKTWKCKEATESDRQLVTAKRQRVQDG